jgi:NADPH:quinone reductase-like Zn-dependent oxidoreductase
MAHSEQNVLWVQEKGGPYQIGRREVPRPGPGFVLVKVESCALNAVDEHIRLTGIFVDKYPFIVGNDGSGTVEQVGEGVSELAVGDRVCVRHLTHNDARHFRIRAKLKSTTVSSKPFSEVTGARSKITSS